MTQGLWWNLTLSSNRTTSFLQSVESALMLSRVWYMKFSKTTESTPPSMIWLETTLSQDIAEIIDTEYNSLSVGNCFSIEIFLPTIPYLPSTCFINQQVSLIVSISCYGITTYCVFSSCCCLIISSIIASSCYTSSNYYCRSLITSELLTSYVSVLRLSYCNTYAISNGFLLVVNFKSSRSSMIGVSLYQLASWL